MKRNNLNSDNAKTGQNIVRKKILLFGFQRILLFAGIGWCLYIGGCSTSEPPNYRGADSPETFSDTENDHADETQSLSHFPFQISNVPDELQVPVTPSDLRFEGSDCEHVAQINTDDCTARCIDEESFHCQVSTQSDNTEIAVVYCEELYVAQNVHVELLGQRPLVLIATNNISIDGSLVALDAIDRDDGILGGFSAASGTNPAEGNGPGGGEESLGSSGSGGGAYCGAGGDGGVDEDSSYDNGLGGAPYGNAEIVPLQGGSSGGKGFPGSAGAGGGALQLVSARTLRIGSLGVINLPGNGGGANSGHGGGSGGAVLLEATNVMIEGVVAANGGGGGAGALYGDGLPGQADSDAALGGRNDDAAAGGEGSSASAVSGSAGQNDEDTYNGAGGGGGGAGWIRINTQSGTFAGNGVISPSVSTKCASAGVIQSKT
ncbi:MAG: hypothetical protein JXX29_24310 [Deltaproteobacteria bacterium]|nr:hypothetical protein [Deltaproteobacteria bacterium]MBN2674827.1 hypothetical protein [Deltaproteobacteria bacterium]